MNEPKRTRTVYYAPSIDNVWGKQTKIFEVHWRIMQFGHFERIDAPFEKINYLSLDIINIVLIYFSHPIFVLSIVSSMSLLLFLIKISGLRTRHSEKSNPSAP